MSIETQAGQTIRPDTRSDPRSDPWGGNRNGTARQGTQSGQHGSMQPGTGQSRTPGGQPGAEAAARFGASVQEAGRALRTEASRTGEETEGLEELVALAPQQPQTLAPVALPQGQPQSGGPAAQEAGVARIEGLQKALDQMEARQGLSTEGLGQLRFDLGQDLAGTRQASIVMRGGEIILTLHALDGADPAQLAALARDMAQQIQHRHPTRSVRVLSDLEEEAPSVGGFDPLRGPLRPTPAREASESR